MHDFIGMRIAYGIAIPLRSLLIAICTLSPPGLVRCPLAACDSTLITPLAKIGAIVRRMGGIVGEILLARPLREWIKKAILQAYIVPIETREKQNPRFVGPGVREREKLSLLESVVRE